MAEQGQRLELVGPPQPADRRRQRLGLGLLLSLVVGFPALSAAVAGEASFELWMARFLLTTAATVGAVLALGWLYDRFTAVAEPATPDPGPAPAPAPTGRGRT